jgi:hypothetical protein
MKIDLKKILEQLTVEQAEAWRDTNEKFLYVDDVILPQHGLGLNSLPDRAMYGVLNAIEDAFEIILENAPGSRALD